MTTHFLPHTLTKHTSKRPRRSYYSYFLSSTALLFVFSVPFNQLSSSTMVALTSRFVLLAALVATSTLAPFLPVANAGVIAVRRSDESGPSASATVEAAPAATVSKEKKMVVAPLPASIGHPSSSKGKDEKHSKKGKGKKNNRGRVCPTFS